MNDDGYVILRDFWPESLLSDWEQAIARVYLDQAARLGAEVKTFTQAVQWFEAHDKDAGYQCLAMLEMTPEGKRISSYEGLLRACEGILKNRGLFTFGPHPFINLPGSKRLLYKWHAESCYYPKRRNFLNVWFPIIGDKHAGNGTMWVAPGSHVHTEWQFSEYQGFDKSGEKQFFVQYEIPARELDQFDKVPIIAKRGDLVIFARSLAHSSTPNQSNDPSFASVMRVFDYSRDLTVAGNPAVQPYTGTGLGRPNL